MTETKRLQSEIKSRLITLIRDYKKSNATYPFSEFLRDILTLEGHSKNLITRVLNKDFVANTIKQESKAVVNTFSFTMPPQIQTWHINEKLVEEIIKDQDSFEQEIKDRESKVYDLDKVDMQRNTALLTILATLVMGVAIVTLSILLFVAI